MLRFNMLVAVIFTVLYIPYFIFMLRKKYNIEKLIFNITLYIYFLFVLRLTLFPILIQKEAMESGRILFKGDPLINLIPFNTLKEVFTQYGTPSFESTLFQACGNFIMLMPLGFLLPLTFSKKFNWKSILCISFLFSFSIELIQFIQNSIYGFPNRFSDIDDIISNTIGALIGYVIYKILEPLINKLLFKDRRVKKPNFHS
ncbi:VanZ family protein [Bacillus inaquosorum]|uniref:VanZ family protein n=3 Tax=Bacillus inaquosorum TaxID=483913 RepID=UPI00227F2DA3|nr:VanZ family protein [Bacillus inaquosorum]MCY8850730.1 VanZ family protein [Bacillus inaquosorum]MCY9064789.1 VanZ family protein [Bacillus inaquosorum]